MIAVEEDPARTVMMQLRSCLFEGTLADKPESNKKSVCFLETKAFAKFGTKAQGALQLIYQDLMYNGPFLIERRQLNIFKDKIMNFQKFINVYHINN